MTTDEAFEFGLEKVNELSKELGIDVKIIPYDLTMEHVPNTLKKYGKNGTFNNNDRATPEKWCRIHFKNPMTQEQRQQIRDLGNYLNLVGMSWDSGGCSDGWDWEWDWSFNYIPKDNQEAREARDTLHDLLSNFGF